ncbi:hypothetical protein BS47DRAFT_1340705 [Hydnum rufescens UP504]|uniref:Kinase-like protein n=1 Tax=Hydnum rufescens UP504 TaxID=1448309 RepID=A0A9P6B2S1_9AGAM|nr:hypothetical protein BS47DRAFT_1340705 [Hydnum rufescens UP504]
MLSGLARSPSPQDTQPNKKFKTLLGLATFHNPLSYGSALDFDSLSSKAKNRNTRLSQFYDDCSLDMTIDLPADPAPQPVPNPVRINTDDGPWTVSVAENPHDHASFSIYVKSASYPPLLNFTFISGLTLREAHPNTALPPLPELIQSPAKRRGSFLHTLSRLGSHRGDKQHPPSSMRSAISSSQTSPLVSPTKEFNDPFAVSEDASSNVGALPAYLSTLANHPIFRNARHWKRFVHVRVDDLESVRVERTIKRVRSDLAGHTSRLDSTPQLPPLPSGNDTLSIKESVIVSDSTDRASITATSLQMESNTIPETDEEDVQQTGVQPSVTVDQSSTTTPSAFSSSDSTAAPSTSATSLPDADASAPQGSATTGSKSQSALSPTPLHPTSHHGHARSARSASADPNHRLGNETAVGLGARSWKKRSPLNQRKRRPSRKVSVNDFEMMRVLGKGCAGKVLLVRHRASGSLYALKAITKRHVLAHQELQHTLTEQAVLKRMAREAKDPFVVKLWWSFHDKENLFLVMDFHPGGDLATQLARWGRLGRDRARFYAAEIVEGVEGLHAAGVVYRDLKPENILIGADGHIVLTDFGLSKEFPRSPAGGTPVLPRWMSDGPSSDSWRGGLGLKDYTTTFCGTAEYLAPEVIQGLQYSYEVDWWSFGTMLYEMLSGITPFWANNHSDMYVRVLQDELQFPEDKAMDQDTKSLIRGLLQRNPALRMREPRVKRHPYFSMIDWGHVYYKRYIPPYIPPIDPLNASDTQNFDDAFLDMSPTLDEEPDGVTDSEREKTEDERTDGDASSVQTPGGSLSGVSPGRDVPSTPAAAAVGGNTVDVFDGYSYKGRQSVLIDEEDEDEYPRRESSDMTEIDDIEEEIDEANEGDEDIPAGDGTDVTPKMPRIFLPPPLKPEPQPQPPAKRSVPVQVQQSTPIEDERPLSELIAATSFLENALQTPFSLALSTPLPPSPVESVSPEIEELKQATVATPSSGVESLASSTASSATVTPSIPSGSLPPIPRPNYKGPTKARREKSGVPALDKLMTAVEEDEETSKQADPDDDDWDLVEAPGGEEKYLPSKQSTSLFARGVVDRYRLAVFRKSTPSRSRPSRTPVPDQADSPSPSEGKRRGRTPGLNLRKSTNKFLRTKSPAPPPSISASTPTRSLASMTNSANGSPAVFLTPSSRTTSSSINKKNGVHPPSLKSKSSGLSRDSVGSPGSSEASANEEPTPVPSLSQSAVEIAGSNNPRNDGTLKGSKPVSDEPDKHMKNFKKMKVGAEKVMSLFASSSPRSS